MRWLLLLGAESRYGHTLEAALDALRALGALEVLTSASETPAADGGARQYRNQLARLDHPGPRDAVIAALKHIERVHGRGVLDGVPLDIDLLAIADDGRWRADPHAVGKGEFAAAHVQQQLREAGLQDVAERASRPAGMVQVDDRAK